MTGTRVPFAAHVQQVGDTVRSYVPIDSAITVMSDNGHDNGGNTDPRSEATQHESESQKTDAGNVERGELPGLMLLALGVVYGDIGTSPIYALRECFSKHYGLAPSQTNVYGVLSLIFWALLIVISLKYITLLLKADNGGEGGILALLALLGPWKNLARHRRHVLILVGVLGAALLYGDMMITPTISVLSAVEGVKVADPHFQPWVIPVTLVILVLLFIFQRRGTRRIGHVFGPVMLAWFLLIAGLGIASIARRPRILEACNPAYAVAFFAHNGATGYLVLSAVILAITGAEALYADLGHFGRPPIRYAWFGLVLPALLLNYFGQGALLLDGASTKQPFFHLAPSWLLYPLVAMAGAATVIASQATISGAFSLTRQAVQLGQMPWMRVEQTSAQTQGRVYVPMVNWVLMIAAIVLVVLFRSSSHLASAYGVAVNSAMVVTTVLAYNVAREHGHWGRVPAMIALVLFLTVELAFLGANMTKIPEGGWFSLGVGGLFFLLMWTWRHGSKQLAREARSDAVEIDELLDEIAEREPARVKGTAVFVTGQIEHTPPVLRHHLLHTKTLHEQVVLLTVLVEPTPKVAPDRRLEIHRHKYGVWRIIIHYGYLQGPNIPSELKQLDTDGLDIDLDDTTYYIGRRTLVADGSSGPWWRRIALVRDRLFAFMLRNEADASTFYRIPVDSVIEIGMRLRI